MSFFAKFGSVDANAWNVADLHIHRIDFVPPEKPVQEDFDRLLASPATALRVLPTMSIRNFHAKILKSLGVDRKIGKQGQSEPRTWIVMGDSTLSELDLGGHSRDLSWWGLHAESHVLVYTEL